MKYFLLSMFLTFSLLSQAQTVKDGYQITVKLKNTTDSACYLAYYFGTKKYVKDTAQMIKPNHFVFKGNKELSGGIYVIYFPNKINFEVLVNEQFFELEVDKNNILESIKFKNSVENKIFYDYMNISVRIGKEANAMQQALERNQKNKNEDSIKIVTEKLKSLEKELNQYRDRVINENPTLMISKNFRALKEPEIPEAPTLENGRKDSTFAYRYMKKHYWDNIDFSDDRILRTPIYESRLERYFDKMVMQIPDSLIKECDMIMEKAKANKEIFKFTCITLTNNYGKSKIMGLDEVFVHMIEKYYATGQTFWVDSADLFRLTDRARILKYTLLNKPAQNLTMLDTNDKFSVLFNYCHADFNILVFWDPDCGHCKKEIPKLNEVYKNLRSEYSINIIGVSTTSLKDKWMKFIREKNIGEWHHMYDPNYTSPFRQLYDITSTPKIYIIGKDKKLIAKQLGAEQIEDFIKRKKKQMDFEKKKGK